LTIAVSRIDMIAPITSTEAIAMILPSSFSGPPVCVTFEPIERPRCRGG